MPPAAATVEDVPDELVDLDLDISSPAPLDAVSDSVSPAPDLDDLPPLELPDVATTVIQPKKAPDEPMELPTMASPAAAPANDGLDFDLTSDAPTPAAAETAPAAFDLNSISLPER